LQHDDRDFKGDQQLDGDTDVLRVAAQMVKLGDDEGLAIANLVE